MQLSALYKLMGGDGTDLYAYAKKEAKEYSIKEAIEQYEPSLHKVANKALRPDKTIFVATGIDESGKTIHGADTAPVSRAPLSVQKYIIGQKGSFARGNGVVLKSSKETSKVFDRVRLNWIDNKTDFDLKEIAVRQMGETQVAVIFYGEKGKEKLDDFKFRYKIVSPSKGDKLYPFFDDDTDDLIAFGREYKRGKNTMFDLYVMNEQGLCDIYYYENKKPKLVTTLEGVEGAADTQAQKVVNTKYNKLPIVYWEQEEGECNDTAELMEELESGFNDFLTGLGYTADPILFAKGAVMDLPAKGTQGKFIETSDPAGDLKYITPDNATEARDLQFKMLIKFIYSLNRAVLLDLETMKDLGAVSGAALERYLTDVYAEATDKQQGSWGKGIQRMVNWLKSQWELLESVEADLRITVVFTKYSLQDEKEKVDLALAANGSKPVVDMKTAIKIAGLVDEESIEQTLQLIKDETVVPAAEAKPVAEV